MNKTSRLRWIGQIFEFAAGGYGVFLLTALLLRQIVGEHWPVVTMINQSLHLLLIAGLALLPLLLALRRARLALLFIPPTAFLLATYAIFFVPRAPTISPEAPRLSVLTYNLQAEETLLEPMIEVVAGSNADVVALQEMSTAAAQQLDVALASSYPYRVLYPEPSSPYHGRGFLSRYPITEARSWPVEYPIPFRLQRVELDFRGAGVTFYNMHAPPSYPIYDGPYDPAPRNNQIAALLGMGQQEDQPVILLGDFNTTDLDENYARITADYADAFYEAALGLGYTNPDWQHANPRRGPSFVPIYQRIDFIFHSATFAAVEALVWPESGGSDHRPLYAVLALTAGSN